MEYSRKRSKIKGKELVVRGMFKRLKSIVEDMKKSVDYTVPNANEKTTCVECDGSGRDGIFHDCEICGGTGIVEKTFKEINNLN